MLLWPSVGRCQDPSSAATGLPKTTLLIKLMVFHTFSGCEGSGFGSKIELKTELKMELKTDVKIVQKLPKNGLNWPKMPEKGQNRP